MEPAAVEVFKCKAVGIGLHRQSITGKEDEQRHADLADDA